MHLSEVIEKYSTLLNETVPTQSVPEWTIGYFKRRSISFANGLTDTQTHVCWLQSRNFTIDLRLPLVEDQVKAKPFDQYSKAELLKLADYEGWLADTECEGDRMSWSGGTSFQIHNRWPEAAELKRVGNCMMEFCDSNEYVEDWRLQSEGVGPLIGLRLIEERDIETGELTHADGGLIINGDYCAIVLGRPDDQLESLMEDRIDDQVEGQLRDMVAANINDSELLGKVFLFETSVAHGSLMDGFSIDLSTNPQRVGELVPLNGFSVEQGGALVQTLSNRKRIYKVDVMDANFNYQQSTPRTKQAKAWFESESQTLGRYLTKIS